MSPFGFIHTCLLRSKTKAKIAKLYRHESSSSINVKDEKSKGTSSQEDDSDLDDTQQHEQSVIVPIDTPPYKGDNAQVDNTDLRQQLQRQQEELSSLRILVKGLEKRANAKDTLINDLYLDMGLMSSKVGDVDSPPKGSTKKWLRRSPKPENGDTA